ncbi:hypothetical protein [Paenibacillus hamazuiensis]|uniref:hypothetical protein n=1 Tax=Paenibacillus hamazuiensis TaxID=2936508 RepID=UPI00200C33FC|nr:hypothetical protein [Paenibacillus hamazuiensis]
MQFLAQYPVSADLVTPYVGRPVAAITGDGDFAYGIIDRIHDGHLVMRPIGNVPEAVVANFKKSMKKSLGPRLKQMKFEKPKIKAWGGFGFGGYPFGWGFGNFGWGAGWWWIFPLFLLAAIAAFPFFW